MISRYVFMSLIFFSTILCQHNIKIKFTDNVDNHSNIVYSIYPKDSDECVKGHCNQPLRKKFLSRFYNISYSFKNTDYTLIIKYKNRPFESRIDFNNSWFNTTYFTEEGADLKKLAKFEPNITVLDGIYKNGYSFKIDKFPKRKIHIKGSIVYIKDYTPIQGARVDLSESAKRVLEDYNGNPEKTDKDGKFEFIFSSENDLSDDIELMVTKQGYLLGYIPILADYINSAKGWEGALELEKRDELYPLVNPKEDICGEERAWEYGCQKCICREINEIWYPTEQVCDIHKCEDEFEKNWYNSTDGSSELIPGNMFIRCEEKFKSTTGGDEGREENLGGLMLSFHISKRSGPMKGVRVFYDRYHDKEMPLGKTDNSGTMKTIEYDYEYQENVSIEDNLEVNGRKDADPLDYFIVFSNDIQSYAGLSISLDYKGDRYQVSVGNFQNDRKGNEVDLADINLGKVYLSFDEEKKEFYIKNIEVLSSTKMGHQENQESNQNISYNIKHKDTGDMTTCEENIGKFKDSIRLCNWSRGSMYLDTIIKECSIHRDRELLMEMNSCYFWDHMIAYDDQQFLENLHYPQNINLFERMDAIYKRIDDIINFSKTDFSNTELARHYHKKFYFYYAYVEILYINQYKIKSNTDIFRYPESYSLEVKKDQTYFKNKKSSKKEINKSLTQQAIEAKEKFNYYKNKAAKMSEGMDVDYLKIPEEYSLRLEVIRKSREMK